MPPRRPPPPGPIAFVALAAPQLAKRLTGSVAVSRAAGRADGRRSLLAVSDLVAQRLFAPTQLPVGIATGAVGGLYLIWLLLVRMEEGPRMSAPHAGSQEAGA